MKRNKMKVIGLAGGVGTGKSTIASLLKEKYHGYVVMADEVGHKAMEVSSDSYEKILDLFGTQIAREDKTIDRGKVADIVFKDASMLEKLNQIIHPFVYKSIICEIEKIRETREYNYFFIESAILIETGYQTICDEIWVVKTNKQVRTERLKTSRGYSEEKIDSIMRKQMSETELLTYADAVIENNNGLEEVERQLENLLV